MRTASDGFLHTEEFKIVFIKHFDQNERHKSINNSLPNCNFEGGETVLYYTTITMTKAPLETKTGSNDVRMRITSTGMGMRYVVKVCHSAEVPLTVSMGPKTGNGQGSYKVPPGKTWRYEFGSLENKPYIQEAISEMSFDFEDGRAVNLFHEVPGWLKMGLGFTGHTRKVSVQ